VHNTTTNDLSFTMTHRFWTYLPVLVVGLSLLLIGLYIDRLNSHAKMQDLQHELINKLSAVRAQLEGNINTNTMLMKGLVVAISLEPEMSEERFMALSSPLLTGLSQIRNIAAAPNLIIKYMNPVAGNEAAIGLNYRAVPEQYDAVKLARDRGELVLAGPVNLVQGGQGFIARIPVFVASKNSKKSNFWGIISSVIDIEKFYTASGLYNSDLDIAIRTQNSQSNTEEIIFGDPEIFTFNPVLIDINLPHDKWELAAIPRGGWKLDADSIQNSRLTLLIVGLVILIPLFVLVRSMQKKKESEAFLRLVFKLSPVGIALNNYETGAYIDANNALFEQTGYTSEEFMKLSYWDITPNKYRDDEAIQLKSLQQTGQYGPYEKEYVRKDGSSYPVLLKGMLVLDKSGNKMIWSFIEDISKRKQAEKSLQRSQKMDAIGQLTGGIAHDFNNILGIILGNLDLLKQGLKNESTETINRINDINKAGQRAVDLTKQLLSFSRNKSSKREITNINTLIEKIDNLISRSVTPGIEIQHQLAKNLWLTNIDQGDFEDALLNLSINARDAMSGHGQLSITTQNVILDEASCSHIINSRAGEFIELTLHDTGFGIPEENLEHIFEPFYTTKKEGKGTGLGLSMVYGFIQRSEGFIEVTSNVGTGTTFKMYLPRFEGQDLPAEINTHEQALLTTGTETLLIVDDEEALLELAKIFLENSGYKVLTATNAKDALQILHQQPGINLLFSDVVMPGEINGDQLAEQASREFPNLKVLLTSGYTGKAIINNNFTQTNLTTNILRKPYSKEELTTRIRALLDKHSH